MGYSVEADKVMIKNDFFIEYKKKMDHKMERPHFHDGYEIHFTLTDATQYFIDGRHYFANSGAVALLNSEKIHRVLVEEETVYERYYVLFKSIYLEFAFLDFPELYYLFTNRNEGYEDVIQLKDYEKMKMINLLNELIRFQNEANISFRELKIKQKLLEIILLLHDCFTKGKNFEKQIGFEHSDELKQIMEFIKNNYSSNITLDFLANNFYISKSTIIRMFKIYLGMTPNEYISYIRFIEARKLLENGHQIRIIAERIGYADSSTFIKKFKKISGISPKQYILQKK